MIQLVNDYKYSFYIDRQKVEVAKMNKDERVIIPGNINYNLIDGLSNELMSKLEKVRPLNLGQAIRIDGMTPAAITLILFTIRKMERSGHAEISNFA